MVPVTAGSGFWDPDKQKIRGARQTWQPQTWPLLGTDQPISPIRTLLLLLLLLNFSCHLKSALCQGSADIQRLMYFYTHIPPPNLPWKCFVRGKLVSMCVFETHTSEKRLNDVFQGLNKYLILQSQATPKAWWKITMKQKMHAKSK